MILLLLGLLGCGARLPERLADCADAECRQAWMLDRWTKDQGAAREALNQVEDPVERVILVTKLVETWPGETDSLCKTLAAGPGRTRCERINSRPHLQTEPPDPPVAKPREAGGPRAQNIAPPAPETSPFYKVQPLLGPCAQRREKHVCYATQALREARQDTSRAASACAGIGEAKWIAECQFSAAEMLINARGDAGFRDSIDLCIASPPFTGNCIAHMLVMLASRTPDATERDPAAWAPLVSSGQTVEAEWRRRDPERADLYVDRFWSEAMSAAYAGTPQVTGGPLDGLPEVAGRHIRAGATLRLMELEGVRAHPSLQAWVDAVKLALSERAEATYRPVPPPPPNRKSVEDLEIASSVPGGLFQGRENLWDGDRPGDEVYSATFFWGTARRTWSANPDEDLLICVLESAGQVAYTSRGSGDKAAETAARALLEEGRTSTVSAAAWTAQRILERELPAP